MLEGKLVVPLREAINWFSCTKLFQLPSQKLKQHHLLVFFFTIEKTQEKSRSFQTFSPRKMK